MKQWKRLAALSSAIVMAAATLTYFPNDTLQNIRWEISASADETSAVTWTKTESDGLTWTLHRRRHADHQRYRGDERLQR